MFSITQEEVCNSKLIQEQEKITFEYHKCLCSQLERSGPFTFVPFVSSFLCIFDFVQGPGREKLQKITYFHHIC